MPTENHDTTPTGPAALELIRAAVDYLTTEDFEGQDKGLLIEMSQAMLADLIETDGLAPLAEYIGRYCSVISGPDDAERIAAEITGAGAR